MKLLGKGKALLSRLRDWIQYKISERQANAEIESRILKVKVSSLKILDIDENKLQEEYR